MALLEAVLLPIVWVFRQVLEFLYAVTGSYGLAIIGLSLFVAFATYPLTIYGRRVERRHKSILDAMAPEIADAKSRLQGEDRFHAIDAIYQKHNYHPIKSISTISGFAIQLPFLLSSLVLLYSYPPIEGHGFLAISDLSKPDQMVHIGQFTLNALPVLMTAVAATEALIKPEMDTASRYRFLIVSLGLLVLVYALPAAVVLYWATSNLWSLFRTLRRFAVQNRLEN